MRVIVMFLSAPRPAECASLRRGPAAGIRRADRVTSWTDRSRYSRPSVAPAPRQMPATTAMSITRQGTGLIGSVGQRRRVEHRELLAAAVAFDVLGDRRRVQLRRQLRVLLPFEVVVALHRGELLLDARRRLDAGLVGADLPAQIAFGRCRSRMRRRDISRSAVSWRYVGSSVSCAVRSDTGLERSACASCRAVLQFLLEPLHIRVLVRVHRARLGELALRPGRRGSPASAPERCRSRRARRSTSALPWRTPSSWRSIIDSRSCSPRSAVAFDSSCWRSPDSVDRLACVCSGSCPMYDSFDDRSLVSSAASRSWLRLQLA